MSPIVPSRRGFQEIVHEEGTLTHSAKSLRHRCDVDGFAGTGATDGELVAVSEGPADGVSRLGADVTQA